MEKTNAFSRLLIPEEGPDCKGEYINLRKKDGSIKWSIWAVTVRLAQNCSTIFKVKRCVEMDTKKLPEVESKEGLVSIDEYLETMLEVYKKQLKSFK